MADKSQKSRIWDFLVIFAVVMLGYQLFFRVFFPPQDPAEVGKPVVLRMQDATVRQGGTPVLIIENRMQQALAIPNRCPLPPVDVFRVKEDNSLENVTVGDIVVPCETIPAIEPGEKGEISLAPWKKSLFMEPGTFELELPLKLGTGAMVTGTGADASQYREGIVVRFAITEPGVFTKMFRAFITKPLLNALIFIGSVIPAHNLGLAIIILTLIVKLLLYIPTQHALEGQKKMQLLQPKIEAIRKQFKDDPAKLQQETMKLWKEHKINPFQSCLPLLVQFPVLIGLFYVVRDGVHLELSEHLIYPFYQHLDWTFATGFLGLDLLKTYVWLFPPLLVIMQFIQMKLTFHIADKKKAKELKEKTTPQVDTPQEMQQKMMLYVLPLMIGFFALKMPSAVALYWGVSTLFAIGQQLIVNREHINVRG